MRSIFNPSIIKSLGIITIIGQLLVLISSFVIREPNVLEGVQYSAVLLGMPYFALWFSAVISCRSSRNWSQNKRNNLKLYLTSSPATLLVIDLSLMGGVLGSLLAGQYSELFSPLLTFLAVLTIEGPMLIFTLRNLQGEEIRKSILIAMFMLLALGYFVLLLGLLPCNNYYIDKGVKVIAVALVSAVLALNLLLSFVVALLHEPE